jgi:hypothetical protein
MRHQGAQGLEKGGWLTRVVVGSTRKGKKDPLYYYNSKVEGSMGKKEVNRSLMMEDKLSSLMEERVNEKGGMIYMICE